MTQLPDLPAATAPPPAAVAGPPPLIAGESGAAYAELLARVTETLAPADVIEHVFIRDVVDLAWEVFRLRRLKANLLAAAAYEGMAHVLRPAMSEYDSRDVARGWAARREQAVAKVEGVLAQSGFTMEHVAARTLAVHVGDFERIDRMMAAAEARRNAALHELDLHRASFALRLRRTLAQVEDAEFADVAPTQPSPAEAT